MQRPLEEEARQEDRAELLGRGAPAPLIPSQLPLGSCLSLHPACV